MKSEKEQDPFTTGIKNFGECFFIKKNQQSINKPRNMCTLQTEGQYKKIGRNQ